MRRGKIIFTCICLIAGLFFGLSSGASGKGGGEVVINKPGNLYILSVGIDDYQDAGLNKLKMGKADAIALGDEFERHGKTKFGKVEKIVLLDGQANKAGIEAAFNQIASKITSDDSFIFTFAGLGYPQAGEFYLFPIDFKMASFKETGVSSSLLQSYFRKIRAANKLIILDSCHSSEGYESASSAFVEQDDKLTKLIKENVTVIGTETVSYENEKTGHGSVTGIVLDGLKGEADIDGDGMITTRELEAHVYRGGILYTKATNNDLRPRILMRGKDFEVAVTDEKLAEIAKKGKENQTAQTKENKNQPTDPAPTRSNLAGEVPPEKPEKRNGEDYAILFANDTYDNNWTKLQNPQNDAKDIAKELKERYGFKDVVIKSNRTTKEIYDDVKAYQTKSFKPDDQLFIFFAGHGVADEFNNGFFVGRDSPSPFTDKNSGEFVQLDRLLTVIDRIPSQHTMIVFDACYAGQFWKPSIQLVQETAQTKYDFDLLTANLFSKENKSADFYLPQISRDAYIKRRMKNKSRIVLTSGENPVPDGVRREDGSISLNSPFAGEFLKALRKGGVNDVLTTGEIMPFVGWLPSEPQKGKLSGSDGDFVFVRSWAESAPKKDSR